MKHFQIFYKRFRCSFLPFRRRVVHARFSLYILYSFSQTTRNHRNLLQNFVLLVVSTQFLRWQ